MSIIHSLIPGYILPRCVEPFWCNPCWVQFHILIILLTPPWVVDMHYILLLPWHIDTWLYDSLTPYILSILDINHCSRCCGWDLPIKLPLILCLDPLLIMVVLLLDIQFLCYYLDHRVNSRVQLRTLTLPYIFPAHWTNLFLYQPL